MGQLFTQVRRAQMGDRQAQEAVLNQFSPLIRKHTAKSADKDACALQLILLQAIPKIPITDFQKYREPDHALVSYIKRTVQRAVWEFNSAEYERKECGYDESLDPLPAEHSKNQFTRSEILDAVSRLPEQQRCVIVLLYFYGYNCAEIGAALHVSRQAVNQMKSRALRHLRIDLK